MILWKFIEMDSAESAKNDSTLWWGAVQHYVNIIAAAGAMAESRCL